VDISSFLRVCEFVSPRHERFRDRDAVVFDFRPRPGFKSGNRQEDLISKLVGVVWIDPEDRQVMRLEARLAEGFKMAGGLLINFASRGSSGNGTDAHGRGNLVAPYGADQSVR
jgi:hypothetical protein